MSHKAIVWDKQLNRTSLLKGLFLLGLLLQPALVVSASGGAAATIIFAGDAAYPPFEWSENGQPRGFNVELAHALGAAGELRVEYRLNEWKDTLGALERGEVDAVPMFISAERQSQFRFTSPFYVVNHALYGSESHTKVRGPDDFSGQRLAVEERSVAHDYLITENFDVQIVAVPSSSEALNAVVMGLAESAIITEPTAEYLIAKEDLPLVRISPPFWPRSYAFALKPGDDELYWRLQNALSITIASNSYQTIYEKWKTKIRPDSNSFIEVPFYVGYTAIIAIILTLIFFLRAWVLRRRLVNKTHDLEAALARVQLSERKARYLADYETETGLARPHHFAQLVDERLAARPEHCELLIFKLVHLNEVRGTLGQAYSTELIQNITSQLKAQVCGPSCYFGRGIFALFSTRTEIRDFFSSLSARQIEDMPYARYVAGSACCPEHGTDSASLIANADSALAIAFLEYKTWVVYDPAMAPKPMDKEIISAFRTGELDGMYAVFQPQIELETERLIGAEALVRWDHPRLGRLNPDDFIPLVERLGYVSQVTEIMIDEAVRLSARLRREGRPLVISVNISAHDLADPDFLAIINTAIERHQGEFCDLKLELTETSFSSEIDDMNDTLLQLKRIGIKVSIDDFGTGYSSLAYLSAFPIQELKIDRTFVSDMLDNKKNCNIIRATLVLAEHLQLRTVAEGIEDQETLTLLKELGCDCAQGYFIAKPLPETEFITFIDKIGVPDSAAANAE